MKIGLGFAIDMYKKVGAAAEVITTNLAVWLDAVASVFIGGASVVEDVSTNDNNAELFTGNALLFTATSNFVSITSTGGLDRTWTFAFSIVPTTTTGNIIYFYNSVANTIFYLTYSSNQLAGVSGTQSRVFGTINASQLSRVVVTVSGTTANCYVNGSQLGSTQTFTTTINMDGVDITIGGSIFEFSNFQIWNTIVSADDITYDYQNPNNIITDRAASSVALSNLRGYWICGEAAESIIYDYSGNQENGTLNGPTWASSKSQIRQFALSNFSNAQNRLKYSNDFTQSTWTKTANVQVVPNSTNGPFGGTNTASLLKINSSSGTASDFHIKQLTDGDFTLNSTVTVSLYVKKKDYTYFSFYNTEFNQAFILANFNLDNGTTDNSSHSTITALDDGWYRITYTAPQLYNAEIYIVPSGTENPTTSGLGTYIYGAQGIPGTEPGDYTTVNATRLLNSFNVFPSVSDTSKTLFGDPLRLRNGALNFNGSGYAIIPNDTSLQFGSSPFTIQFWVKPYTLSANDRLVCKGSSGNGEWVITIGNDDSSVKVVARDSTGGNLNSQNKFSSLTLNEWQMITVVIDTPNNDIIFYKNVETVITKSGANWSGNFNNTEPLTIATNSAFSTDKFLDGLLASPKVYIGELTYAQIVTNYNAEIANYTN